ncbi:flagellar filament capping protein FliD [Dactylosporangium sp. AC04546]|uniref:flagellar filament capping protein FliD n=1 Tax=Dactylosporangium sp. AC04546 TaxID=2862460 RepID=UPI001EDD659C|nr:flagellar filament capping protein FliD [Dactylosporangium sp. AC04546]WVK82634.1 flagellar filament capping protein FliD [Dactylosporangium sp. AC04546]
MVTGGSVDGLISGMSTSTVISQLMQVEAAPQTALKNKVTAQQKVVGSYQSINTKMSALLTAAKALNDPTAWKGATATSSSDAAVATTTSSSQAGSLTFAVKKLASAHSVVYDGRVGATTDTVTSGSSIDFMVNGQPRSVPVTDTSLKGVVDAVNKTADLGVKATAVQVEPGRYTIQLTSTGTGASSEFSITGGLDLIGTGSVASQGDNAELSVGTTNPFTVKSETNTFKGLLDGLTITAAKVQAPTDPPVTVTVASDTEGIAGKVQAMVDAANATLSEIATQTRAKSGDVAGGPLAGNSSMQSLATSVLGTVSGGAGSLGSLKDIGIELTRDGKLSFNKTTFLAQLQADPVKTQSYFNGTTDIDNDGVKDGFADKLVAVADKATQINTGTLSRFITSGNDAITELNDRIGDWDVRLEARQATLQKQFTAMETALGKLKNQSSWLAGQLSSLG